MHKSSSDVSYCIFTNSTTGTSANDGVIYGLDANENGIMWLRENNYLRFGVNNTERVTFNNSSPYAYKTSGGSWGTLSDQRLKTNIREITDPLGKLILLEPKHFEWINTGENAYPEGTRTGFIAQEVEQIFPGHTFDMKPMVEADIEILGEDVKAKGLDMDMIPYIIGAIKQMKEEYEEQITILQARVEALEN